MCVCVAHVAVGTAPGAVVSKEEEEEEDRECKGSNVKPVWG